MRDYSPYLWVFCIMFFMAFCVFLLLTWSKKQREYYEKNPEVAKKIKEKADVANAREKEKLKRNDNNLWANFLIYTICFFVIIYFVSAMDWWVDFGYGVAFILIVYGLNRLENFFLSLYAKVHNVGNQNAEILKLLEEINEKVGRIEES